MKNGIKKYMPLILPVVTPILLFAPYSFVNQLFLVEWLGCGCVPSFNANDFTALFWGVTGILSVGAAILMSHRISVRAAKIAYILCIAATMVYICNLFNRVLMWK